MTNSNPDHDAAALAPGHRLRRGFTACALLTAATLTLSACGDDSSGGNSDVQLAANKIYELTAHTRNDASCDADGESILDMDTERYFSASVGNFAGVPVATVSSCASPQQCRDRHTDANSDFPEWSELVGGDSWTFYGGGVGDPGAPCSSMVLYATLATENEGNIARVEVREYEVTGLTFDSEGFCDATGISGDFDRYTCLNMEVYTGTYVEDL